MKVITIAGTVGKDATLRDANGNDVLSFSVAVDDGYGERKTTLWFDVSLFGKRAVSLEPHIKKGMKVTVSGELSQREYEGKTYLTCRANEIALQGSGNGQGNGSSNRQESNSYREQGRNNRSSFNEDMDGDSIPF